uniref:Ig-like domain-containing protein n=1 Tax=Sinocyclocheilus anshuiensis TaxID=1608454 RepID=A0A671KGD8_9TELE
MAMVTSQSETHSSTMQTFESVSTVMMSTTSVKSIEVQQVTSMEEYSTSPTLTLKMSDVIVSLGDVAQFNCSFSGQPFTEIIWDHNGRTITNTERVQYVHQGGLISLIIFNVHLGDQGKYSCNASNRFGKSTCTSYLHVKVKDIKEQEETFGPEEEKSYR